MFARAASRTLRSGARLAKVASAAASVSTFAHAGKTFSRSSASAVAAVGVLTGFALSTQIYEAEAAEIPFWGVPGTTQERTFIAVKPDGVQRGLISEVINRFEKKGYKLVALKLVTPSKEFAEKHYADLSGRPFFRGLVSYFSSGPVVAMVWEGTDVILTGRKILGATNPNQAQPGTLRGDNCISTGRNLVHGSDGPKSAEHEIKLWFKKEEVQTYTRALDTWIVADN